MRLRANQTFPVLRACRLLDNNDYAFRQFAQDRYRGISWSEIENTCNQRSNPPSFILTVNVITFRSSRCQFSPSIRVVTEVRRFGECSRKTRDSRKCSTLRRRWRGRGLRSAIFQLRPLRRSSAKRQQRFVAIQRIHEIEKVVDHEVMALVEALAEVSGKSGAYVHLGATSADILDTALALQMKDGVDIIALKLDDLSRCFWISQDGTVTR